MADDPDSPSDSSPISSSKSPTTLSDAGIKYFASSVDAASCKPIIEWILEENLRGRHERLTLIISSYGGDAHACFAVCDALIGSKIPVDTVGLGYIASAGFIIFIHGAKRTLTNNTYSMSHQFTSFNWAKYHELVADRKVQDWLKERFIQMYLDRSGGKLTRDTVEKVLLGPSDTFLTAQEVVDYGLADSIKL